MRRFSNFEKDVMRSIVNIDVSGVFQPCLQDVINNYYKQNSDIYVILKNENLFLLGKQSSYDEKYKKDDILAKTRHDLISIIVLIKYLSSKYLINLDTSPTTIQSEDKLQYDIERAKITIGETENIGVVTNEVEITKFYNDHLKSFIYVSDALRHIVNNNDFNSDDQIIANHQLNESIKQTKNARRSVLLALLAVIASIVSIVISALE